jgi:hypothetical protein
MTQALYAHMNNKIKKKKNLNSHKKKKPMYKGGEGKIHTISQCGR